MKRTYPRILTYSIVSIVTLALGGPLSAATTDTFSGGGTFSTPVQLGAGPGAVIVTEGTNSFLRLLDGVNSENNAYAYDLSDLGAFETINAAFDFRILPGTNGLADGLGFMLLPTSGFGGFGAGPSPTAEEPNVANTFGLGIDVYQAINNISAHWNGFQVNELNTIGQVSFRDNAVFNRVQVVLQRVGNATNATVTLTPDSLGVPGLPQTVMQTVIPNMLPYESRVQFSGRTGGENMRADVDNVNVSYSNPYLGGLSVAPTGHLFQDFDSIGTTAYRAVQGNPANATMFRPGPLIKAAGAGTSGAFMRIVNDGVEGQSNRIAFDRAFDGGLSNLPEVLQFDLRFNSTDTPADGLGLVFLPTKDPVTGVYNTAGDGINSSEEPNHIGILGIGFDVYDNGAPDISPGVSLHFNGSLVKDVSLPANFGLGQFHRVQVIREPVAGGINVSITATPDVNGVVGSPVTLMDRVFVTGATNFDYRVQFSGRTGGANADHDVDNIVSSQLAATPLARTQTDFTNASGSAYKAYRHRLGAPPDILNEFAINGEFLRLAHDNNNDQTNSIAFDKQLDGSVAGANGINMQLDFRMGGGAQSADGFALMLIPTSVYGNTGPGVTFDGFVSEEPNVAGVFGVGWDVYNGANIQFNELSVHWNNSVQGALELDPLLIDLDSGVFHNMRLELRQNGLDALLDLVLTPDVFGVPGTPVVVFDDLFIPGMNLYDYRVELASRTGGLNMSIDIDNLLVDTVPEPGTAAILCAGVGMLSLVRRKRRA